MNIPAPVVGGLLVAAAITAARAAGHTPIAFDTAWQTPLMIAFFTSLGFGASLRVLRTGGPAVLLFLLAATVAAVGQNLVGGGLAWALGESPLLGVLIGSVTLAGGPATGLAFAPLFELHRLHQRDPHHLLRQRVALAMASDSSAWPARAGRPRAGTGPGRR